MARANVMALRTPRNLRMLLMPTSHRVMRMIAMMMMVMIMMRRVFCSRLTMGFSVIEVVH